MKPLAFAIAGVAMMAAPAAHAQLALPELSDQALAGVVAKVRTYLPQARLPDGSPVLPEMPAEPAQPIITNDIARGVVRRGSVSGLLAACGGDWSNRSFLPMMAEARARNDLLPKQLAFIGLLHGIFQGAVGASGPKVNCDATLLANLDADLRRPVF